MSDAAVATIVSGAITITGMIIGFFTMLIKLKNASKQVEDKIDANTEITQAGTDAAASNAKEAVHAANSVAITTSSIDKKLNGGLHKAINDAIDPIKGKMEVLEKYVHQRNHDVLDGMQLLSTQMTLLARKLEEKDEQSGRDPEPARKEAEGS